MALFKEKYSDSLMFYFIEYNREHAKDVIEELGVTSHPQTYILDKDDNIVYEKNGFDSNIGLEIESVIKKAIID